MVDFGATITDSNQRKLHELNLGLLGARGSATEMTLYYRIPQESELAGFGMEGFKRRLEERVKNSVGDRGLHMVDQPVEFEGDQAAAIRLTDQALINLREIERADDITAANTARAEQRTR